MPDNGPARIVIRELTASEVAAHADELADLQRVAYRVEAALIDDDRIPQLSQTAAELMAAELTWREVVEGGDVIAAVATSQCPDGQRDIQRLLVAPYQHRRGPTSALVRSVSAGATVVAMGRDNVPARCLYQRLRFHHVEDREVLARLWVLRVMTFLPNRNVDHLPVSLSPLSCMSSTTSGLVAARGISRRRGATAGVDS